MPLFPGVHFPATVILRHRKENLNKCSLRGLEAREDMLFLTYPKDTLPDLKGYFILDVTAPLLSEEDHSMGLLLIDGTWRYAQKMTTYVLSQQNLPKRRLPDCLRTAYPRRQEDCPVPDQGLASVEALYASYYLMRRSPEGLLDHYHWKDQFLNKNKL